MTERPDYWIVVALDYAGTMAWLMATSPDCKRHSVTEGSAVEDFSDMSWAKDKPAGLYRLELSVSVSDCEMDVSVRSVELLLAFPPVPAA